MRPLRGECRIGSVLGGTFPIRPDRDRLLLLDEDLHLITARCVLVLALAIPGVTVATATGKKVVRQPAWP